MTHQLPLVSVCIPVYNTKKYIVETIHSVVVQGYPNLEIIVQDNASTDGTWQIVQKLATKYPEMSIEKNDHNVGMAPNWNLAINRAKGDYVMLLSADDLLEPGFLKQCIDIFKDLEVDVVTTNFSFINQNGKIPPQRLVDQQIYEKFSKVILLRNPFSINFTLFSKQTVQDLKRNNLFFSNVFYTCDYDLWYRLSFAGKKLFFVDEPLGIYRLHENNLSKNEKRMWRQAVLVIMRHSEALKDELKPLGFWLILLRFNWRLFKDSIRKNRFDGRLFRVLFGALWK